MIPDLPAAPLEYNPTWAVTAPIAFDHMRSGVLYTGLHVDVLRHLLTRSDVIPCAALGALGRGLFFGRSDGPWVPFDRGLVDQNLERKVSERSWPYCWGDELWMMVSWSGMAIAVHVDLDPDEMELFAAVPTATSILELQTALERWASSRAGAMVERLGLSPFQDADARIRATTRPRR